jgi:hypothetical protein
VIHGTGEHRVVLLDGQTLLLFAQRGGAVLEGNHVEALFVAGKISMPGVPSSSAGDNDDASTEPP